MTTALTKVLERAVVIDGVESVVALAPTGVYVRRKGARTWRMVTFEQLNADAGTGAATNGKVDPYASVTSNNGQR